MNNIETIKAFKTTDGQIFTDENEADKAQKKINFNSKLSDLCYKGLGRSVCYSLNSDDVIEFIKNNKEELKNIIGD